MHETSTLSDLPNLPAVYALYGGRGGAQHAAYVGVTDKLRQRIRQHLVSRDSSVVTGASVVSLNPDLVREVRWWRHPLFGDPTHLQAAELVAFDTLRPVLASRAAVEAQARARAEEAAFRSQMEGMFTSEPEGRLVIPTLEDAMERLVALERRIAAVEARLGAQ